MKNNTSKVRYRGYEIFLVPVVDCGIEYWVCYVNFGGMANCGSAMSFAGVVTIGKTFINQIAV